MLSEKIDTKFSVNTSVNTHKNKNDLWIPDINYIQLKTTEKLYNRQKHLIFKKVDNFDGKDYLRKSFENKITLKLNYYYIHSFIMNFITNGSDYIWLALLDDL